VSQLEDNLGAAELHAMAETANGRSQEQILKDWIERHVGGQVVRIDRVPRWRPSWTVDFERDGKMLPLYVKGSREGFSSPRPVQFEGRVFQILSENGLPAPRQYGYCEEAQAIVMQRLPGRTRPRPNDDPREWEAVLDQYIQALVNLHRLDPQLFADSGIPYPRGSSELRLSLMNDVERTLYLPKKKRPEPCIEFMRLWMRRNLPAKSCRPAFITGDSFQMIYDQGKLLGFLDLEMGLIGDPMLELAGLTLRSLSEPTSDFANLCRRYAALSGEPLDLDAIFFHVVGTGVMSAEYMVDGLTNPDPKADYHEYYTYYLGSMRVALEVIAEIEGTVLHDFEAPLPRPSLAEVYLGYLRGAIQRMSLNTNYATYERDKSLTQMSFLERRDRYGGTFDREYLEELAGLLGYRPETRVAGDIALEAFVTESGAKHDEVLLQFLYKHVMRACFLAAVPEAPERNKRFLLSSVTPMLQMYRQAAE
jgi:hypothetical protein